MQLLREEREKEKHKRKQNDGCIMCSCANGGRDAVCLSKSESHSFNMRSALDELKQKTERDAVSAPALACNRNQFRWVKKTKKQRQRHTHNDYVGIDDDNGENEK